MLMPFLHNEATSNIDILFEKMKETKENPGLVQVCRDDPIIQEFAKSLLDRLGLPEEQRKTDMDNIRTKVRTLGRALTKFNQSTMAWKPLSYFLIGKQYNQVVENVKDLSVACDSPQLAITLGHYVKQANLLKIGLAIINEDKTSKEEAEGFEYLYKASWNSKVASVANRRQRLRALNKPTSIPETADLVSLKEWISTQLSQLRQIERPTQEEWNNVARLCLVRILLFNKRRVAEVEEVKVQDYNNRSNNVETNEEVLASLSMPERALARRMEVLEVRGKSTRGLRKVFILLTEDMVKAINYLLRTRTVASDYIFGRKTNTPIDGCSAMRTVTSQCPGLKKPHLIRTRKLRKYMATLVDMTTSELKMVADHMGHDVNIHTNIYRLQSSLLEKTKVARVLIAIENGSINQFAGQSLENLREEDLPVPISYSDAWSNTTGADDAEDAHPSMPDVEPSASVQKDRRRQVQGADDAEDAHPSMPDVEPSTSVRKGRRLQVQGKRQTWSKEENEAIYSSFKPGASVKKPVSVESIRRAQKRHRCLQKRTEAQIRSKIHNVMSGKDKLGKM